jgi:hypothetical protein
MEIKINDLDGTVLISQRCPITQRVYGLTLAHDKYLDWLAGTVPTCALGLDNEEEFFLDHGISPSGLRTMQHSLFGKERKGGQANPKVAKATGKTPNRKRPKKGRPTATAARHS